MGFIFNFDNFKKGKKKIAYAGESHSSHKEVHLINALKEENAELFCSYKSSYRFGKAGEECAKIFLKSKEKPDAVICAYDEIAFGFIHTIEKHGIRVPEDVAVIGINNVPSSEYFSHGLTTVGFDFLKTFSDLIDDLCKENSNNTFTPTEYNIPSVLVKRNTV